jgi:hypothetical protein
MTKKPKKYMRIFPADIASEENGKEVAEMSLLEAEIVRLIDNALKERLIELSFDDIRLIAKELMPDMDQLIANKVKEHFYQIGNFLVEKFGDVGE